MSLVEKGKFVSNPYRKIDPYKIDPSRLTWNRTDLDDLKEDVDDFLSELSSGSKVGMRVIGAVGSGKTWLSRIIEIELKKKTKEEPFSIYTKIPKIEPLFSNVYRIAIKDLLENFDSVKKAVNKLHGKTDLDAWNTSFKDEDIAQGFSHISTGGDYAQKTKRWIEGNRVTSTELTTLNIINPIISDYRRFDVLTNIFSDLNKLFSCTLFIVDELENASLKLAGALGDGLRDILDIFDKKFGLICLFTAESFDEWYDAGYTEPLTRRFDYHIKIEEIQKFAINELISKHHKLYRKKRAKIGGNQLYPFTPEAINRIYDLTPLGRKYPGYIFPNLEAMLKLSIKRNIRPPINEDNVTENASSLPYSSLSLNSFV